MERTMSKKKIKLSKIVLDIEGKKVELTLKQAQLLQELLNDTFGDDRVEYIDRWHDYRPYYHPWQYNTYSGGSTTSATGVIASNQSCTTDTLKIYLDDTGIHTSGHLSAA